MGFVPTAKPNTQSLTQTPPCQKERRMDFIKKYSTGFTMITNTILQDKDLSLRAKGLYTYLFSKPDGWEFHISAMVKELKETEGQIRVIVQELLNKGYIVRHQVNENGKFGGMVYEFVDIDRDGKNRVTDIPCSEKSAYGKTSTHNNTESTSNTDYISNTEVNNNTPISNKLDITPTEKIEKKSFGEFKRVKLTDEEFKKLNDVYSIRIHEAIQMLDDYLEYKGHKYKSHYAVLKRNNWVYNKIFSSLKPNYNGVNRGYETRSERNQRILMDFLQDKNEGEN